MAEGCIIDLKRMRNMEPVDGQGIGPGSCGQFYTSLATWNLQTNLSELIGALYRLCTKESLTDKALIKIPAIHDERSAGKCRGTIPEIPAIPVGFQIEPGSM